MCGPLTILVVEDDENDALLLEMAFVEAGVNVPIHFVRDGKEAIDYLRGDLAFKKSGRTLPKLLVLDLKMPRVSGFQVLEWLRRHPELDSVSAAVLSGSAWGEELDRAYALGANFCITKPLDFEGLVEVARRLNEKCSLAHVPGLPRPTAEWSRRVPRARV